MEIPVIHKTPEELAAAAKDRLPGIAETAKEKLPDIAETAREKIPGLASRSEGETETVYSRIDEIPSGEASDEITEGCIVLEGGAFRGLYTQGVLDALMQAGINFQTTIGISAGALSGIAYVSGDIGWAAHMNLMYRHDPNYIGIGAMQRDHGITGFTYMFEDVLKEHPLNEERFYDPRKQFVACATNLNTGEEEYFERDKCRDILRAAQASATVPYVSRPVVINQTPYLDGGMVVNIPYHWAKRRRYRRIVVVKTRDRSYRSEIADHHRINQIYYHNYPKLLEQLEYADVRYNCLLDEIDVDEEAGICFVMAPKEPVEIDRFEGDLEKLGDLYWAGYHEMQEALPALRAYLES